MKFEFVKISALAKEDLVTSDQEPCKNGSYVKEKLQRIAENVCSNKPVLTYGLIVLIFLSICSYRGNECRYQVGKYQVLLG